MLHLSWVILGLIATSAQGAPVLNKRIAQTISAATAKWEKACLAAGGGQRCNPVSVTAFSTLLAAPGPCEQQDAADQMIDLAKQLGNDAETIRLAQIFAQQPRNTPTSQSVPYCQKAPKNTELNGLFQCQFAGANPTVFVGGLAVGQPGTIPFGKTAPISPPGSCPAHLNGPITDGSQLVDIVQTPGVGSGNNGNTNNAPPTKATTAASQSSVTVAPATPSTAADSSSGGFKLQNGKDAQALNAKFATLNANSPCNIGDQACIAGGFAQCVSGAFVITQCAATTSCFSLPLVNSPGTSIACTTDADAEARFTASGATGGVDGSGDAESTTPPPPSIPAPSTDALTAPSTPPGSTFKLQNGKDAQKLNAQFASLTEDSACVAGDQACIGTGFAQCVNGKFVVTPCGATLTCVALPLVNKPGTSITCDTMADAITRIQATGVTGGITGA